MPDRPEPDRQRGPSRPLSERAARFAERMAATDRRERFTRRLEEVTTTRRDRRRRRRRVQVLSLVLLAAAVAGVGVRLAGSVGAVVGFGILLLSAAGLLVVRRIARRRGATAWDWQLQRHRLLGNPSDAVRRRDPPKDGPGMIGHG